MNFIKEFFLSDPDVLPEHLKNWQGTNKPKPHTDWPFWPLTKIPRSFMVKGPRAKPYSKFWEQWPPRLVDGFDITRWEWCDEQGNNKEIYIPSLEKKRINSEVYIQKWVYLNKMDEFGTVDLNDGWWPSCIPTTSEYGWLKTDPWFYCAWRTTPSWRKYYYRVGYRYDFDQIYNPFPYIGRNPE